MKRLFILVVIAFSFATNAQSQSIDPYSELGLMLGTSYYLGDLNDQHFRLAQPAGAIQYKTNFNRRLALRGALSFGEIRGSDKLNEIDTAKFNRNLHFKSSLYELSGVIEFNFFPYETGNKRYPFTPYIFSGFSLFNFSHSSACTPLAIKKCLNSSSNSFNSTSERKRYFTILTFFRNKKAAPNEAASSNNSFIKR